MDAYRGEHKMAGGKFLAIDFDGVIVDELGIAAVDRHVVAFIEGLAHRHLTTDDRLAAFSQLIHRGAEVNPHRLDHRIAEKSNRVGDRVAQRFARDRAAVSAAATDLVVAFGNRGSQATFGSLHRRPFTARACSHTNKSKSNWLLVIALRSVRGNKCWAFRNKVLR